MMNFKSKISEIVFNQYDHVLDAFETTLDQFQQKFDSCTTVQDLIELKEKCDNLLEDLNGTMGNVIESTQLLDTPKETLKRRAQEILNKYFPTPTSN